MDGKGEQNRMNAYLAIALFLFGMLIFGLANIVIAHLPKTYEVKKWNVRCDECGHKLSWKDQIPVVSSLLYWFHCPYCKKSFSLRYALIELLGGVVAVLLYAYYGCNLAWLTVFLLFADLTIIFMIDHDTMIIPVGLNIALFVYGVISIFTMGDFVQLSLTSRMIGMFSIALPMYLIILLVPGGFGGGDVKMMFAIGFFLGWKATVVAFFIGLFIGAIYGIYGLIRRKMGKKDHFAFGPSLCIGVVVATFYGNQLMDLYLHSF